MLVPTVTAIPTIVCATAPKYAILLFILAIKFPITVEVVPPFTMIPRMLCAVVPVVADTALMLFARLALPIVLLVILTVVPPAPLIPLNTGVTVNTLASKLMPEIILFAILIVEPPPVRIPIKPPVLAVVVNEIAPFVEVEPIKFPAIVPMSIFPLAILIPTHAVAVVLAVVAV